MREQFYKLASLILVITTIVLWSTGFFLHIYTNIQKGLVLLPFIAIQILISYFYGKTLQKVHHSSYIDTLTNLGNRRYFYDKVSHEMKRINRSKKPISLLMIDLDNFKHVNDSYGHVKGDEALKKVANILVKNVRTLDIVARWGGDEFAIVLPETDIEGAKVLAERLRKEVEDISYYREITISIGVASVEKEVTIDNFVNFADRALYKAKKIKNKVILA